MFWTFLGPVMMKQVCWHSVPEGGQSEAHGDSNLYTMVRPSHRKTLFWGGFGTSFCSNLAAVHLHGGRIWRQRFLPISGARAEPLQAAAQSVATGISTVLLWLADAIRCFLMLALRPSRRTRQNRNRQQRFAAKLMRFPTARSV